MRNATLGLVLATLPPLALPAQGKQPSFHLPAGELSVGELLDLCELSTHATIARPDDADVLKRRLRLQTAQVLGADAWQDVLGALLWSQGLVLAFDANDKRYEVRPLPTRPVPWVVERARDVSFADAFARLPFGPVRVALPASIDPIMARSFLAPSLAEHNSTLGVAAVDGALVLTGLGDVVRTAAYTITGIDPVLAAKLPAPAFATRPEAGTPIELAKGSYTVRQLADRLGKELHRNVVVTSAAADTIEIGATSVFAAPEFEAAISAALWTRNVVVVPLSIEHAVYEAIAVPGSRAYLVPRLAQPMEDAEVLARKGLVAFVRVSVPVAHLSPEAVAAMLRPTMAGAAPREREVSLRLASTQTGLVFLGLTSDVAPLLTLLREKDVPPAEPKK